MALQIRRGLNQERLNITPLAGEVVHVTDWKAKTKLITAVNSDDTITSASHGWVNGDQVMYKGPTAYGLTQGNIYYIRDAAAGSYKLSTVEALTDTVNITATVSGLNYPVTSGPKDADGDVVGTSVAPMWIGDGTTVGGVAVGAWTLDDLYDVEIASDSDGDGLAGDNLANEQHLEYDASTQQWYNRSNMIIPGTLLTRSNVTFGDTGNETVTFYSPTVSAPNDLDINSGQLFIDQSTGFIGVGDSTPSYKLDVNGNIRAVGDVTIDGGDLISSTTTFNLVNTTATTVNTGGAATTYNIGHSSGTGDTYIRNDLTANQNADVLGNLTVNGNTTLGNANDDLVTVNGNEILMSGSQPFVTFGGPGTTTDGANTIRGIRGNVTEDDYWFVGAGADGEDDGYLLIATSDNAATGGDNDGRRERILVRRYGGSGSGYPANTPWGGAPVVDEMELFDLNGYTTIPNRLGIGITPTAKLDVNGSGVFRGDYLTTEGELRANGGSITSSQATLTINAGGQVTIDDNLTVSGNLTVNGTTTTVNSTTLTVDDKNIELASTASPSDTTANGGGITLKGTTDKTIIWDQVTGRWTFNQDTEAPGAVIGNISIGQTNNQEITTTTGDLYLNAVGADVRVSCDFVAEGELRTHDNQITFKSNLTTAPSENIQLIVERGTSANVEIRWNESTDRWETTVDGSTYIELPNQGLDTADNPSFAGATLGNITVGVSADGTITTTTGSLLLNSTSGSVISQGDFIAQGQLTTYDNIILVNADVTGAPTENGGLFVNRGTSADVGVRFNETTDKWGFTNDGTTYVDIATNTDTLSEGSTNLYFTDARAQSAIANTTPTLAGVTVGNITVGVATDNTITTTTGDLTVNAAGGEILVEANLIAKGQLTTYDNFILVNADVTGAPTENGGLTVNRGTSPDVAIRWNESLQKWGYTNDGTNYNNFLASSGDSPSFIEATIGNVLIADDSNNNTITTTSGNLILDAVSGTVEIDADVAVAGAITIDSRAVLDTATLTTSATTADQVLDSNSATTYRTMKYVIQIASGTDYQSVEALVIHNGTTASITTYADIKTGSTDLATFAADISSGNVRLLTTPTNAVTTYQVVKTLVTA